LYNYLYTTVKLCSICIPIFENGVGLLEACSRYEAEVTPCTGVLIWNIVDPKALSIGFQVLHNQQSTTLPKSWGLVATALFPSLISGFFPASFCCKLVTLLIAVDYGA
jgi:hypothetical protein